MSSAGGCPSWQAMVSVRTSIVPPGPCPPLADTPGTSPAATTPQVTASIHDFAGSLGRHRVRHPVAGHLVVPRDLRDDQPLAAERAGAEAPPRPGDAAADAGSVRHPRVR